jgi:ribosome-associated toxin RatA of RatAB toxin-antitoxin module
MKEITRSAIVEHSAAQIYALVDDIESYPHFLPWCRAVRVEKVGEQKRATLTVGLRGIQQSFTTLNENHPATSMHMRLLEGPFREFSASWRFTPLADNACEITFTMRYQFASRALSKLLEPLFGEIADTMVGAFTRRADELHPR